MRYWDGQLWTEHYASAAVPALPAQRRKWTAGRLSSLIVGVYLVLLSLGGFRPSRTCMRSKSGYARPQTPVRGKQAICRDPTVSEAGSRVGSPPPPDGQRLPASPSSGRLAAGPRLQTRRTPHALRRRAHPRLHTCTAGRVLDGKPATLEDVEQLALERYRWKAHLDDQDSYWFTVKQASDFLGVSIQRVKQYFDNDQVPYVLHCNGTRLMRREQLGTVAQRADGAEALGVTRSCRPAGCAGLSSRH
jgi:hypothetical protein